MLQNEDCHCNNLPDWISFCKPSKYKSLIYNTAVQMLCNLIKANRMNICQILMYNVYFVCYCTYFLKYHIQLVKMIIDLIVFTLFLFFLTDFTQRVGFKWAGFQFSKCNYILYIKKIIFHSCISYTITNAAILFK